ncbi:MAG: redox-sensing transcriptional repressor Rex [Thermoguttaceae bacterium]
MMNNDANVRTIPWPSVQRLPVYLRFLKEQRDRGNWVVSCTQIAEEFGQLSVQVRKDLSITGIIGRPRVGYKTTELVDAIEEFLGWNTKLTACLVGAGSLGSAILGYEGFAEHGLNIVCAFDTDPKKIGTSIHDRPVYDCKDLETIGKKYKFQVAILTVPASVAQQNVNKLLDIGVRAVWNYTPVRLDLPDGVICEEVRLSASFAVLSCRMKYARLLEEPSPE